MTEREKLINLFIEAKRTEPDDISFSEWLADFLLANGVIVPPCKIGDTVYAAILESHNREPHVVTATVKSFDIESYGLIVDTYPSEEDGVPFSFGEIGKWVFFTHEEAEALLKECEQQ